MDNQENCRMLRELIRLPYRILPEWSSDDSLHSAWREVKLRTRVAQSVGLDGSAAPIWYQRPGGFFKSHRLSFHVGRLKPGF